MWALPVSRPPLGHDGAAPQALAPHSVQRSLPANSRIVCRPSIVSTATFAW
ncbi:MAG: hypothetical protein Q8M26_08610 [Pseudolabrys sp.]|nr:hypothetical protein [Pseudolabrys sp.]